MNDFFSLCIKWCKLEVIEKGGGEEYRHLFFF